MEKMSRYLEAINTIIELLLLLWDIWKQFECLGLF